VIKYLPKIKDNESKIKIIEPSVGEGIFLELLLPRIITKKYNLIEVYGYDIDPVLLEATSKKMRKIASTNVLIRLFEENFLYKKLKEFPSNIDLVIGNPPYGIKFAKEEWVKIKSNLKLKDYNNLRNESSIYFALKSLEILRPKGIMCLILPKPIIYSKRWSIFRQIILTQFQLLEVLDLCNVFSGQLQEQCVLIIRKHRTYNYDYETAFFDKITQEFISWSKVNSSFSSKLDNFLVTLDKNEINLIEHISTNCYPLKVDAFRGIRSSYRVKYETSVPLYEKANIFNGFLAPAYSFLADETPIEAYTRIKKPKVIAQRIISYKTKPYYQLHPKVFADIKGEIISHETVVNIYPIYDNRILPIQALAGLIQSTFVSWWLKHAVYTKRFVTSKDFDREYIKSILVPEITEVTIKKFHSLGESYLEFQNKGEKLKTQLLESYDGSSEFRVFRNIYRQIIRGTIPKNLSRGDFSKILGLTSEIKKLKNKMDEIVFSLYGFTKEDIKLIVSSK